jgi:hypothetical protein
MLSGALAALIAFAACPVAAIEIHPLQREHKQNLYRVICDNGGRHTIIADTGEQDFRYYYSNKGYFIKYYDMTFQDIKDFAAWVCRNK